MTEHASDDDLYGSDNTTHSANLNAKFKIGDEFLKILRDNNFNGIEKNDILDHMAKVLEISEWIKILKNLFGSVTTWEDLVEKFVQKFYHLSYNNEEMEVDEDNNPDDVAEIFKIEGNLFDFETPLCKAFNEFNYLLKIDTELFTFDIQEIGTYAEHE
ncbi:hypothetical protein Tco_0272855 [Tanacetum coccineum]